MTLSRCAADVLPRPSGSLSSRLSEPSTTFVAPLQLRPPGRRKSLLPAPQYALLFTRVLQFNDAPCKQKYIYISYDAIQFRRNSPGSCVMPILTRRKQNIANHCNENRSASRDAVRAADSSRAPPALSCRTRRSTRRSPPSRPSSSVLPAICTIHFNENPSACRAAARGAVRSRAPPALSSQHYTCSTIQRKSLSLPRRRTCRSPLSRPSRLCFHPRFLFIPVSFSSPQVPSPLRFHPRFIFIPVSFQPPCVFVPPCDSRAIPVSFQPRFVFISPF